MQKPASDDSIVMRPRRRRLPQRCKYRGGFTARDCFNRRKTSQKEKAYRSDLSHSSMRAGRLCLPIRPGSPPSMADLSLMGRLMVRAANNPPCKDIQMKQSPRMPPGLSHVACAVPLSPETPRSRTKALVPLPTSQVRWTSIWTDRSGIGEMIVVPRYGGPTNSWLSHAGDRLRRAGKLDPTAI